MNLRLFYDANILFILSCENSCQHLFAIEYPPPQVYFSTMKNLNPYLFFNGQCKAAMEFYNKNLGGELEIMTVGDAKQEIFKDANQNLVMHSMLKTQNFQIMGSDNMEGTTVVGDNVCIIIDCSSREELDRLFGALSKGGESVMKPSDTFWGAYFGSLTDQFGISWMFNFQA